MSDSLRERLLKVTPQAEEGANVLGQNDISPEALAGIWFAALPPLERVV
ncbi:hypothetical protein J2P12_01750 [Candidatus Bathyarchaeota archaeon]|nr:hypothetical protein [Candidatus Bathyarchaeota archaeon]